MIETLEGCRTEVDLIVMDGAAETIDVETTEVTTGTKAVVEAEVDTRDEDEIRIGGRIMTTEVVTGTTVAAADTAEMMDIEEMTDIAEMTDTVATIIRGSASMTVETMAGRSVRRIHRADV